MSKSSSHVIATFSPSTLAYIKETSRYPLWARADIVNALKADKVAVVTDTGQIIGVSLNGFSDPSIKSVTVLANVEKFMLCKFYMRNKPDSSEITMYMA